jgi:hypothetical protein
MATVAQTPTVRKAFYATLYDDQHGVLGKLDDGRIYFFAADGQIIDYEPEMAPWVCIFGEVGLVEAQKLADIRHGGHWKVACDRAQEVA